jgi:hypothetical protein
LTDRFIAFDRISLGKQKIKADNDDELVVNAVLASEIVHKYADGMAYKPADELERAAWTVDGRWVKILDHPAEGTIQKVNDISGKITDPTFVKNLIDPKTGRPSRKGIVADIHFFKHARGKDGCSPVSPELIERIRSGDLSDVSVGFTYEKDVTPGEFEGTRYDYAQTNFFFDHLAAPIEAGRCPTPLCGIGMDATDKTLPGPRLVGLDPWEEAENYIRSGHGEKKEGMECRTTDFEGKLPDGIKAIYCHMPDSDEWWVQSYLFDKKKFTMEQAKAWLGEHKGDKIEKPHVDLGDKIPCPICDKIKALGDFEFSKRLVREFGLDAVLKAVDAEEKTKQVAKTEQAEAKKPEQVAEKEDAVLSRAREVTEHSRKLLEM